MAVTPAPTIDLLPDPPLRNQSPDEFNDKADPFLAALPPFGAQLNAAAQATEANAQAAEVAATTAEAAAAVVNSALAVSDFAGFSDSEVTPGTGEQVFATQSGKAWQAGDRVTAISLSHPNVRVRGEADYSGSTLTLDVDEVEGSGGPYDDWLLIASALEPLPPWGEQQVFIPAMAMVSRTTSGPAPGQIETSANKINVATFDFDPSAKEYAQFQIRMPRSWDEGAIRFRPEWSHGSTTTNFGVTWSLRAVAIGDGEAIDAAFGTAGKSTDTGGTTDYAYTGPESGDITVAGTPQPEDWVVFEVYRDVDDAGDTLAVDARLHGITLIFTTDARNDA